MPRNEFASWPLVLAKHVGAKRKGAIRLLVIHTPEWAELADGAEKVAEYFASMPDNRVASAHILVDNNSVVRCVPDDVVAFAAPGTNNDGVHIELVGRANQTTEQWNDVFSLGVLALGADTVAQYCLEYDIPRVRLTDDELGTGFRGIVGHDQVSRVYKKSDHTDPGEFFPWSSFLQQVELYYAARKAA